MAKIIQLPARRPSKLGFKRAKKDGNENFESQLDLFNTTKPEAQIIPIMGMVPSFENALKLDYLGDSRAKNAYLKAIENGDCAADCYCNLGIIESQMGNTAKAIDCFTNALKLEPRHLESHYNLANLYFDECELKLAKLHYEIALEIDPDFANIYFNLGLLHAMNENMTEAVKLLKHFKKIAPPDIAGNADELLATLMNSVK
ncbi:MAG: tetratricopeptide repeat protein [Ignavibacteria bacterium]